MSTAATSLANLLNLLDLPRRLHFVNSGSQTPSDVSQNALNTIGGPVRITPDTSLLPSLHPLLYQYARDWPIPDTALPRLQSLLYGLSELAQSWADPLKRISGEVGVQSFIATFLAESVNKFLSETAFASAGCRLYWRIVGLGKSGRPDLELVLSWMDDRGQVIEKILAVIEVKTTYSMSPSHATNIRQATDAGIIIDQRGEVRVAQAQRLLDGPKRIIQQVVTEISSRDVHLAVLTNFDSFHIFRRLNDHHAGGYSLEMSDTIFSDAPSLPTVLHRSRLGFLLGVTLLALDLEGHGGLWRRYAGGPGASQQFDADANSATGAPIAGGFAAPFGAPNSTGGSASQTYSPAGPSNWEMDDDKGSGKAGADDGASTRGAFATGDIKTAQIILPPSFIPPELPPSPPGSDHEYPSPDHPTSLFPHKPRREAAQVYGLHSPEAFPELVDDGFANQFVKSDLVISLGDPMLFKKAYHPLPALSRPFFLNLPPTATSLPVLADVSAGLLTLHPSGAVPAPTDAFGRNTVTHLPSEPPRPAIRLELTAHRGHGGLWDAFSARLSSSHNASLIIKLVNISSFPLTANELDFSRNILSEFEARRDVLRELKVYSSEEGSRLQGSVIPEFLGLVGSLQDGGEVWVAILEDAGDALKDGEKWVPGVRHRIRQLYTTLHTAGILHADVQWRHVIARQPPPLGRIGEVIISSPVELDRIRLVDFGRAKMRSDESDERWQWLCGDEMAEVEEMLRA